MEKLLEQILNKLSSMEENQNQLQTQLTSIQSQVNDIQAKVRNIQAEMCNIQTEMRDMQAEMRSLQTEVSSLKDGQKLLHADITEIKMVQKEHSELLLSLKDQLNELDAKNATNHTLTIEKIDVLSNDLDFLTHKEIQTEKEVYTIKKKLQIIK
ncbi:hypothetical protein Q428_03995 [Fervidicella metallireducens AeB]|uniref:Uncharacterized protein n=1 Tax=Fervidicella metallireducens AeB TaxID=1403537 RepID=A0A017RWL4_9CLOT|nr:hypothetical protein [Fervidicella metallireducens]EYE89163.1 hypothetical protein Q428_03995 [Fervidicella metallireducens AeB]